MKLASTIKEFYAAHVPRATTYLLYLLFALIPFSVRYVLETTWSFHLGFYSDFTAISLYISDLVLGILIVTAVIKFRSSTLPKVWIYSALGLIAWLTLELIIQNRDTFPLQLYFSVRLVALLGLTVIVANFDVSREKLSQFLVGLGVLQAIIAIVQFLTQKSIGLSLIGESPLGPHLPNIANLVSHGTKVIRSYGTFPHPNVLAGFLVFTILLNLYLLTKKYQLPRGILLSIALIAQIFGLFLTFSRGGLLGLGVGLTLFAGLLLINKQFSPLKQVLPPVLIGIVFSITILAPYLGSRTTVSDNASKQRLFFNDIAGSMIKDKPVSGQGTGMALLHMKQYSETPLEEWEIRPIHNYYLISWAELGFGAIFLLIMILYPISTLFMRKFDNWSIVLASIGVSLLVMFLVDHYSYTIWQTQLLLWAYLGLCLQSLFHMKQVST